MVVRTERCRNANHGRPNAPVRVCPMCGQVVNHEIPETVCSKDGHATRRRNRNAYCMDCGEQLSKAR